MKKLAFLLLALFFVTRLSANARSGNELGNGGDQVAQEFIAAGRKLVEELRLRPDPRIPDVEKLAAAVESVKVSTAESLTLHGQEVDAINFPEDRHIDVSRSRWRSYGAGKKASLVLHEYLSILRVDDRQYEISGSYAEPFAAPEERTKGIEISVGSSYGFAVTKDRGEFDSLGGTSRPGIHLFAGKSLSPRSTLGIVFASQKFHKYYPIGLRSGLGHEGTFLELTMDYKYWLSGGRDWRPYVTAGAGYARYRTEFTSYASPADDGDEVARRLPIELIIDSLNRRSDVVLQAGIGMRYAVLREIGLDLAAQVHSLGAPWTLKNKIYISKLGVDVLF